MSESPDAFRSVEAEVVRSFDQALSEAKANVEEAKAKALAMLKV